MTKTLNHGYNTPSKGTTDWHIALNENFDAIDTRVEIRDTEARKDEYEPKAGAKFFATDTGAIYLGDGESWSPSGGGPSHDSTVYTTEYAGNDASERFQAAVNDISGGTVVIPGAGRNGGRVVDWNDDVRVNPTEFVDGLTVHVQAGCRVRYRGSGVPLTFDADGDVTSQINGRVIRFVNQGRWDGTQTDTADGGLHFVDINQAEVNAGTFYGWRNNSSDCYAVRFSNHKRWSENNTFTGNAMNVDRGFVWSGFRDDKTSSATSSLQDQHIHGASVDQHYGIGFEFDGDLSGTHIDKPTSMNYSADAIGYKFSARCDNIVVTAPECEEFGEGGGSSTMFAADSSHRPFGNGPLIINPGEHLVTNVTDGEISLPRVMGEGLTLPTPDGRTHYQIAVDNDGNVTTREV